MGSSRILSHLCRCASTRPSKAYLLCDRSVRSITSALLTTCTEPNLGGCQKGTAKKTTQDLLPQKKMRCATPRILSHLRRCTGARPSKSCLLCGRSVRSVTSALLGPCTEPTSTRASPELGQRGRPIAFRCTRSMLPGSTGMFVPGRPLRHCFVANDPYIACHILRGTSPASNASPQRQSGDKRSLFRSYGLESRGRYKPCGHACVITHTSTAHVQERQRNCSAHRVQYSSARERIKRDFPLFERFTAVRSAERSTPNSPAPCGELSTRRSWPHHREPARIVHSVDTVASLSALNFTRVPSPKGTEWQADPTATLRVIVVRRTSPS